MSVVQVEPIEKAAGDEPLVQALQARQCELRMLALLCFSSGPLSIDDAANMLRLMVSKPGLNIAVHLAVQCQGEHLTNCLGMLIMHSFFCLQQDAP